MQRRKFSREFKLEEVKLVRERGVSMSDTMTAQLVTEALMMAIWLWIGVEKEPR